MPSNISVWLVAEDLISLIALVWLQWPDWEINCNIYFLAKKTFPKAPRLMGFKISKSLMEGSQCEFVAGFFMKESEPGDDIGLDDDSDVVMRRWDVGDMVGTICDAMSKMFCD